MRLIIRQLSRFPPTGAVFDNPISQRSFKSDVVSFFFGLDPFVAQNFFALGLKLAIERGVFDQIIAVGIVWVIRHKRYCDVSKM